MTTKAKGSVNIYPAINRCQEVECFFEKNRSALHVVVDQACEFIAANTVPDQSVQDTEQTAA